jgi:hypothetical protein
MTRQQHKRRRTHRLLALAVLAWAAALVLTILAR